MRNEFIKLTSNDVDNEDFLNEYEHLENFWAINDSIYNMDFPAIMKFEMNQFSYPISTFPKNDLDITAIKTSRNFIGFLAKIKAYDKYIIGAYGLEMNTFYTILYLKNLF